MSMPTAQTWSVADVPYHRIERDQVRHDEALFFVLAGASLVESDADVYTEVLQSQFAGTAAGRWLQEHWQPEELQHGRALRRYVETVWPELPWQLTYDGFHDEYSQYCSPDQLAPTPALELVARCVVETSTAALYRAIGNYAREPVLKQLVHRIRDDEVRHYKYFHRFFSEQNRRGGRQGATAQGDVYGRWPILKTLVGRLAELRNEDADCALRHVFLQTYPDESTASPHFAMVSRAARGLVMRNISPDMMVRMLLLPLRLPTPLRNSLQRPCAGVVRRFMTT